MRKHLFDSFNQFVRSNEEYSWEELKSIERRRRAVLRRSSLPFWRILTFWDGTCLRILVHDVLFWISIAIFVGIRCQARWGIPDAVSDLDSNDIGVIGGFLSFFLVFFVVQSNNRFDTLYAKSMVGENKIFDVAMIAKASLPIERAKRLVRYMNAAHVAAYVGISEVYSQDNFYNEVDKSHPMLTREEMGRINTIGMDTDGSCYRELVSWAMVEIQSSLKEGYLDPRNASHLRGLLCDFREAMATIYELVDQPILFFYVHFISLLSFLYLPLFAVSAAYNAGTGEDSYWTSEVVAGLIVMLQNIFVIGLRVLGLKMADPYGDDIEDLSVMHYVTFTYIMSNRILASLPPGPVDAKVEDNFGHSRESIGDAFEQESW
eukprot:CAMPEP_0118681696 /NCGR_PEP_ID=MMETSP0800-20121206/5081_1 /TAXON_ID=210618 ORGANISM="Striatella unipunctata, Strain CCMP2910" /NCGR_SAMPLE_ID=MMETSP0800 /ASSEMBLY_ACC=CAM_ASM_000638 /LENGTH=375 /DNA_ID=CAMNT_0006578019 /DNA_START=44 /DNA_END=1171 /DNA_ORIENTATION=+